MSGEKLTYRVTIKESKDSEKSETELFLYEDDAKAYAKQERENGKHCEITDLKKNKQWINEQALKNRKKEYPPLEEMIEALFDDKEGDSTKLEEIKQKRALVKQKYPLVK